MKEPKFKFSVIIPVYNVEKYLSETVDSVIAQTIGFKENIQIIFINDGSPDNSEEICLKYQEKYPENILYIKQENGGVSSARNNGINYIQGKYVNFLDSDDCWTPDSFEIINRFFEENDDKMDVVAARKKFFDARDGWHRLDYKYKTTRVVNLNEDYDFIQMDVTGSFIKAEAIQDRRFSTKLKYGEDAQFINSILLDKCKLGVVREAIHLYRKRPDESSALQNELSSESYYIDSPEYFHKDIIQKSEEKYGCVKEFIQYTVMYDLQWRLRKPVYQILEEKEYLEYEKQLREIISKIEDRIIFAQKDIFMNMKIYCLNFKYQKDLRKEIYYDRARLIYQNIPVISFHTAKTLIIWQIIEIKDNILHLEGKDNCWLRHDQYDFYARINDEKFYPEYMDCPYLTPPCFDGSIETARIIKFDIPLRKGEELPLKFVFCFQGFENDIFTSTGKFAHIPAFEGGYYVKDEYILRLLGRSLYIAPNTFHLRTRLERLYRKKLISLGKGYLIKYRILYSFLKKFKKKKLWLISDRMYKADDNGEHFFKYIKSIAPKDIKPVFNLNKNSEDYARLRKIGKVMPYDTPYYRINFLLADKIISSGASEYLMNAFENDRRFLMDLYHFDFVFLQHGVTKDDISEWIHKYNKNMKMIVAAGKPEYESFGQGNYYYSKDVPALTGFPRHDNLLKLQKEQPPEKKIVIIPTWRKSIKGSYDIVTSESIYFSGFKKTEYFQFYNSLINHDKLRECMRKNNYKGILCMHPIHNEQWVDFEANDEFSVNHGFVDYQNIFTTASLLVTDYSSVAFDFAYLKKPVVYCQFDAEQFFSGEHSYTKGYFSYENNGFGPVCKDLETTVHAIIKEIENNCRNSPEYMQRVEEFYPYFDGKCCERVYQAILKI